MSSVSTRRLDISLTDDEQSYLLYLEHEGRAYFPGTTFDSMEVHGTAKEGAVVSLSSWTDKMAGIDAADVLGRPANSWDELVTAAQMRNPNILPPKPEDWLWRRLQAVDEADVSNDADYTLSKELRPSSAEIVDCCKQYVENCRCDNCQPRRLDTTS